VGYDFKLVGGTRPELQEEKANCSLCSGFTSESELSPSRVYKDTKGEITLISYQHYTRLHSNLVH